MENSPQKVFVIGLDNSNASLYSFEWTLDELISPLQGNVPFKVVIVHAKIPAVSVVRYAGPGVGDFLQMVEHDLKKTAVGLVELAKNYCKERSISEFEIEVCDGDPRNVLCEAVEKHHADLLVVGSHGYGAFKRAILGSVSDYCAHHAHCCVLIVKKPKSKTQH